MGRRRRAPIEMLKWFGVVFVVLAVAASCAPPSFAATERKPVVDCGGTVRWYADTTYGGWSDADKSIAWAYKQVGGVTGTKAVNAPDARVVWEWQSSLSGGGYNPGKDYWDETFLSGRRYWVHAKDGDSDQFDNAAYTREVVLRDILRDFGVPNPTSTSSRLSKVDRRVLRRNCEEQTRPLDAVNGQPKSKEGAESAKRETAPTADSKPEPPYWAGAAAWLMFPLLLVALLVDLVAPGVVGRVRAVAARQRDGRGLGMGRVPLRARTRQRRRSVATSEWSGGDSE